MNLSFLICMLFLLCCFAQIVESFAKFPIKSIFVGNLANDKKSSISMFIDSSSSQDLLGLIDTSYSLSSSQTFSSLNLAEEVKA